MTRILVVEDEANIRKFVAINLSARGYEVIEAETASEGLSQLRAMPPAVLVLDIKLPDMTGWQLLEIMAAEPELAQIPVIVITASPGVPAEEVSYDNLRTILIKPISAQELTQVVQRVLA